MFPLLRNQQTCVSDKHNHIIVGPIFTTIFVDVPLKILLMQHKLCCVNLRDTSWEKNQITPYLSLVYAQKSPQTLFSMESPPAYKSDFIFSNRDIH